MTMQLLLNHILPALPQALHQRNKEANKETKNYTKQRNKELKLQFYALCLELQLNLFQIRSGKPKLMHNFALWILFFFLKFCDKFGWSNFRFKNLRLYTVCWLYWDRSAAGSSTWVLEDSVFADKTRKIFHVCVPIFLQTLFK